MKSTNNKYFLSLNILTSTFYTKIKVNEKFRMINWVVGEFRLHSTEPNFRVVIKRTYEQEMLTSIYRIPKSEMVTYFRDVNGKD